MRVVCQGPLLLLVDRGREGSAGDKIPRLLHSTWDLGLAGARGMDDDIEQRRWQGRQEGAAAVGRVPEEGEMILAPTRCSDGILRSAAAVSTKPPTNLAGLRQITPVSTWWHASFGPSMIRHSGRMPIWYDDLGSREWEA